MGDFTGLSEPQLSYLGDGEAGLEPGYLVSEVLSRRTLSTKTNENAASGPGGSALLHTSCDL